MSELSKEVNKFFLTATKQDVDELLSKIYLSEHQKTVLLMRYIENKDIDYIAYKTGYSRGKIEADLRKIRSKFSKVLKTL